MEFFYKISRPIIAFLFRMIYNPKYTGIENIPKNSGCLLVGNHTNNLDCLFVISSTKRTIHFLAKHTLLKGIKAPIFKAMGIIAVDRTKRHNEEALNDGIKVLKNDGVIGIFPEGTINRTNDLILPFRYGAVKMSKTSNKPIVPFVITGKYKIFKRDIKITFGPPFYLTSSIREANASLEEMIKNMLRKEIYDRQD